MEFLNKFITVDNEFSTCGNGWRPFAIYFVFQKPYFEDHF